MADDVNVKEIDLLKTYSGKLGELKDYSLAGTVLIYRQVEKIKADLEQQLKEAKRLQYLTEEKSRYIVQCYKTIIDETGEESRSVIGSSDLEAVQINDNMNIRIEQLEDNIRRLQTLLENVFQHTKNYGLQVTEMVDSCKNTLSNQIQALEEYKKQHM